MYIVRYFTLLLATLLFCSCSIHPRIDTGLLLVDQLEPQRFQDELSKLLILKPDLSSFRALSRSSIQKDDQVYRTRQIVVFDLSRLAFRQETLAPNSAFALEVLVANENQALFLDTTRREYRRFETSQDLFEDLIGLELDQLDLSYLFFGDFSRLEVCQAEVSNCFQRGFVSGEQLIFESADKRLRLQFDPRKKIVTALELLDKNAKRSMLVVRYSHYQEVQGFFMPMQVRFVIQQQNMAFDYHFTSVKLNAQLSSDLFRLTIPSGYQEY